MSLNQQVTDYNKITIELAAMFIVYPQLKTNPVVYISLNWWLVDRDLFTDLHTGIYLFMEYPYRCRVYIL